MSEHTTFDAETAKLINRRPGGSRHLVYSDASGAICLWCNSKLGRGGVAISAAAIDWLDKQEAQKFIRLTNPVSDLDIILPADQVPFGDKHDGQFGIYFVVDLDELRVPKFTPVATGDLSEVPF